MINKENEIFDILVKHILNVFDENDNIIKYSNLEFKKIKSKHSACYSNVLFIDGKQLTSKQLRTYKVEYLCRCGRIVKILLRKYKDKQMIVCQHCIQDPKFEYRIHANKKGIKAKQKLKKILIFDEQTDEFKQHYNDLHLTVEEFYKYLPYIYQINTYILNDELRNKIIYKYAIQTNNQLKFTSKISFDNIKFETIKQVKLLCNICKKPFNIHLNNIREKDLADIKCRNCSLTNYTYKIQLYKNTNLTYQSKLELYFIEKCVENNINILNGIEIPYYFNNSLHTYISDFYLPDFNYIIEIKSKNKFYKDDLISGKIKAKNIAAINYNKSINFKMLFDQDINDFILTLLNERDSLNYCESNRNQDKEPDK